MESETYYILLLLAAIVLLLITNIFLTLNKRNPPVRAGPDRSEEMNKFFRKFDEQTALLRGEIDREIGKMNMAMRNEISRNYEVMEVSLDRNRRELTTAISTFRIIQESKFEDYGIQQMELNTGIEERLEEIQRTIGKNSGQFRELKKDGDEKEEGMFEGKIEENVFEEEIEENVFEGEIEEGIFERKMFEGERIEEKTMEEEIIEEKQMEEEIIEEEMMKEEMKEEEEIEQNNDQVREWEIINRNVNQSTEAKKIEEESIEQNADRLREWEIIELNVDQSRGVKTIEYESFDEKMTGDEKDLEYSYVEEELDYSYENESEVYETEDSYVYRKKGSIVGDVDDKEIDPYETGEDFVI